MYEQHIDYYIYHILYIIFLYLDTTEDDQSNGRNVWINITCNSYFIVDIILYSQRTTSAHLTWSPLHVFFIMLSYSDEYYEPNQIDCIKKWSAKKQKNIVKRYVTLINSSYGDCHKLSRKSHKLHEEIEIFDTKASRKTGLRPAS